MRGRVNKGKKKNRSCYHAPALTLSVPQRRGRRPCTPIRLASWPQFAADVGIPLVTYALVRALITIERVTVVPVAGVE